ncbi:iron-containing alcohol dehydrogenase [Rubrimonas sp.]|uniref:iron-containing alcohol dehydrogenase n=1 Tax=Rubrimonas sp. TaxID=2036015 RepID=UPI002FDCDF70
MTAPFAIRAPREILFGRGVASHAARRIAGFGDRVALVHGAAALRARWLIDALRAEGCAVTPISCAGEPDIPMLGAAVAQARAAGAQAVAALGGGSALDLGKAVAALVPARRPVLDHMEVVGAALPLDAPPLPFVAIPTTAGTGAEATKNAVIAAPDQRRKASLRDDRMLAALVIVDPALTDGAPKPVTLACGLDALTQLIEAHVSCKATPFTDALTRPAIAPCLRALRALMEGDDAAARDAMAWASLSSGLALANGGLGAVHGFAGALGGWTGAAHGAICGALLPHVLRANAAALGDGPASAKLAEILALIAAEFGAPSPEAGLEALASWSAAQGLPGLGAMGLEAGDCAALAEASRLSSSMKGNPVALDAPALTAILRAAL